MRQGGYLAAAGHSLAVPTGRATPAVFDCDSGTFQYFRLMQYGFWVDRKGAGPFVSFIDDDFFIAEDDVFQASDGIFVARGLPVSSCAVLPEMLVFSHGHEIRAIKNTEIPSRGRPVSVRNLSLNDVAWRIACSP